MKELCLGAMRASVMTYPSVRQEVQGTEVERNITGGSKIPRPKPPASERITQRVRDCGREKDGDPPLSL